MTNHGLSVVIPLSALLATACAEAPTAVEAPAAVMMGEWRYARGAPAHGAPTLNAGFFVTIAIDSAADMRFWGRVTAWFVGDVGIPIDRFGPVTGTVDDAHSVTLRIAAQADGMAAHSVKGQIDGDVIVVLESWAGVNDCPFSIGGRLQRLH